MKKILVIDDDTFFQTLISEILADTYIVHFSDDLKMSHESILQCDYDLFIVDITLPDGSGLDLCSFIKYQSLTKDKPIIIVSGKSEIEEKLKGFDFGADDYITKPFHPKELLARISVRLKNNQIQSEGHRYIRLGEAKIDLAKQRLIDQQGKFIELTQVEFKLLVFFAKNEDCILTRSQILEEVWTENLSIFERVVDTHISHLRKKVRALGINIKAVHGVGYCFSQPRST